MDDLLLVLLTEKLKETSKSTSNKCLKSQMMDTRASTRQGRVELNQNNPSRRDFLL